jgi:hypothetical protein
VWTRRTVAPGGQMINAQELLMRRHASRAAEV